MSARIAVCSLSGGKDSCLAYYYALRQGYEVRYLLNFVSRETKRGCFHGLEAGLLRHQAELLGRPLLQYEVSPDMQTYEEEFKAAVSALKAKGVNAMVFGDIYLQEHRSWVERVCADLDIEPVEPLWQKDPESVVREFIALGFKAIVVSCKADILDRQFIGRIIDDRLTEELKAKGICPCGEGGEFHTLTVDGPVFKQAIQILKSNVVLKDGFWKHWFLDIEEYS
jgi:uncharacterized protein (TIGR00290 family)